MSVCVMLSSLIKVILSVLYDTNGLTLDDFYPYGEQHGDTAKTNENLPILLHCLNQLITSLIWST